MLRVVFWEGGVGASRQGCCGGTASRAPPNLLLGAALPYPPRHRRFGKQPAPGVRNAKGLAQRIFRPGAASSRTSVRATQDAQPALHDPPRRDTGVAPFPGNDALPASLRPDTGAESLRPREVG